MSMAAVLPTATTNAFPATPPQNSSSSTNANNNPPTTAPHPPPANSGTALLHSLLRAVRELQTGFGNRNTLATDADPSVCRVCDLLDTVLSHGLKQPVTVSAPIQTATALLQNVADRVAEAVTGAPFTGSVAGQPSVTFWSFALPHLTAHERERFCTLQHVATDTGRGRALLRAALNERSLERYVLVWLNAPQLFTSYEPWAALRDPETSNLLPSIAAGLATILFAVLVDNAALNARFFSAAGLDSSGTAQRTEPIIVAPPPSQLVRSVPARRRHLVSFGEDTESADEQQQLQGVVVPVSGSPGRTLSSMCLKQTGAQRTQTAVAVRDGTTNANVVTKPWSIASSPPPPCRPYDAVFGLLPELPSEIVQFGGYQQTTDNEGSNNNDADPPQQPRYELISEHDELADYLALEIAEQEQRDREKHHDNNTKNSSSSLDETADADAKSLSSSSFRSSDAAPDAKTSSEEVGIESRQNVSLLKERLLHMTDRCAQLESRVAQLSLENHRLRGLCDAPGQYAYFGLSIPRVYLDRSGRKPFYVYEVRIAATPSPEAMLTQAVGTERRVEWTVLRRYSDFYELHRKYRRQSPAVKALEFPPKKHFGNMDTKFVELRRQRLQVYIRHFFAVVPESRACATRPQLERVFPFFRQQSS